MFNNLPGVYSFLKYLFKLMTNTVVMVSQMWKDTAQKNNDFNEKSIIS